MADPTNLFWDSSVFDAYLYNQTSAYDVASIRQFLDDARNKLHVIYTSTLSLAEVLSSKILAPGIGSMSDFLADFVGHIVVIDPSPNVMQLAGRLRDIQYKKAESKDRVLSTPDAIMLATCLTLEDVWGVKIDVFHTFDDGKKGKYVPLLSYHDWCDGLSGEQEKLAKRVCALSRSKPVHPAPPLFPSAPKTR